MAHPIPHPDPHQGQPVYTAGAALDQADAAMILVHGRGSTAQDILTLADEFQGEHIAYVAAQAAGNSWYPHSFLAPLERNEPALSSALRVIAEVLDRITEAGISSERILIGGFSQGACLASEFVARHPRRYGGILVFSGGLIGPPGTPRTYAGTLNETPIFIGCSDVDPHIPVARVHETTATFQQMGARVTEQIYPGMAHTIVRDEIDQAQRIVDAVLSG